MQKSIAKLGEIVEEWLPKYSQQRSQMCLNGDKLSVASASISQQRSMCE